MKTLEASNVRAPRTQRRFLDNPVIAWVLLVAGILIFIRLAFRSWIPHDEGTLGQAATRVLGGEIPHIDFHDTYGGLQAYLHAGVFSVIGESVRSLRVANIIVAAVAAHASFTIVRRVQPIVVAASASVGAVLVGFAVYPASMPSWWNAALALASVALVLRWLDSRNLFFLGAAGLLTGLSFLVKSTGAHIAAAIALYLVILASSRSQRRWLMVGIGWAVVTSFGVLLSGAPSTQSLVGLLLPLAAVTFIGFRSGVVSSTDQDRAVPFRSVILFSTFFLIPPMLYALPYVWSSNGDALVTGWFRLPQLRFAEAVWIMRFPWPPVMLLAAAATLIFLVHRRMGPRWALGVFVALEIFVAFVGWEGWWSIMVIMIVLAPLLVSAGIIRIGWSRPLGHEHLLCGLTLTAFAFIQFPMSNAIYALYLVPLIATVLGVWIVGSSRSKALACILLLTSSIVAIQLERDYQYIANPHNEPVAMVSLDTKRGGIEIPESAAYYIPLVNHLEHHEGSPVYAGPDSPEVYFLTGTSNPTPVFFDFLADEWSIDDLSGAVQRRQVEGVVVNGDPDFSSPLPPSLLEVVGEQFPNKTSFGPFDVYEHRSSR